MRKLGSGAIIIGIILIIGLWLMSRYNHFVSLDEAVANAWAKVESAYQRRSDLIPNIVKTAQGYAQFESKTLQDVVNARSKATSVTVDPTNITPEQMAAYQQAQDGVSSALSRLLAVVENYPDLKANENFKELINELERTENQINVERNRYNDDVNVYNRAVRTAPSNLAAMIFGFDDKPYFEAEDGAEKAPEVEFNFSN